MQRSNKVAMKMMESIWTMWMWPIHAAQFTSDMLETISGSGQVIAKRLPTIEKGMLDPWSADHRELNRMVMEKATAFEASGRATASAGDKVRRATAHNAKAMGRMASGSAFWPSDWMRLAEANLAAFAALVTLPSAALSPVHRRVTANQKRLR